MRRPTRAALAACTLTLSSFAVARATDDAASAVEFDWSFEAKGHYRDSSALRFASPFPFPPDFLPPGATRIFLETVDAGEHVELSAVTLFAGARWGEGVEARLKLDAVDRYDRNPTSSDREWDVDELWVRFGHDPATSPDRLGLYAKLGKFPHFERQNDRHLESYGLVSTAFNRFEDQGLEIGLDLGRHLYLRASATQGNPVFFRDPNALAGDNGTPELDPVANPKPNPRLKSGFPILYDAEVEDPDFGGDLELAFALGLRFGEPGSGRELNLRELARSAPVIPDLMDAMDALAVLRSADVPLALVHDEYGHFDGIVTPGSILAALAGAFHHDIEEGEEPDLIERDDGSYLLSGAASADVLADRLGIQLPADRDFSTVAGFALEVLKHLPEIGERFTHDGWSFEVVDMDGRKIDKLIASRPKKAKRRDRVEIGGE